MRGIYNLRCKSGKGCYGRKGSVSVGSCWRHVKYGLVAGNYADGYMNKNKQSYPYTATASAKNAGKEFFEKPEVGFTNLLKNESFKNLTSVDAPIGAVLVYEGGTHGHVEVKTNSGEFISDYRSHDPIDVATSYLRNSRKLIGIYVKID